jgi:RimJ/RimL family protein N-acetyltransferase
MTLLEKVPADAACECRIAVLETGRLVLRAPGRQDAKAIAALAGDIRVAEKTARIPHPYGIEDAEQFLASVNKGDGEICFAIVHDATLIGLCGIARGDGGAEIGYWLGVPYWGRGFATEAVRGVIDHAFGELGHATLQAGALVGNPASRRVLEKCGFQWTGVCLNRIRAINSAAPADRFRLDRGLWASLKQWGRVQSVA